MKPSQSAKTPWYRYKPLPPGRVPSSQELRRETRTILIAMPFILMPPCLYLITKGNPNDRRFAWWMLGLFIVQEFVFAFARRHRIRQREQAEREQTERRLWWREQQTSAVSTATEN